MGHKKLLVLAASRYQVPTIAAAKRLGYYVITTDNIPTNPGHQLADQSYNVDTTDVEGVLSIAKQEQIDGIIAPCTDVAVPTAAQVAARLGIDHAVSPECAAIATDKFAFRQFLQAHQFPVPASHFVGANFQPDADLFRVPWIIKPNRSSGSKGTFILRSLTEFQHRLPDTFQFSVQGGAILEEFLDGWQGTCEGVLQDGRIVLGVVMDRQTFDPPYTTTAGHHLPSCLPQAIQDALFTQLEAIWSYLGVTSGVFDCDFVACGDKIYILEVSPRMGGNSIATLLAKATGFNLVEYSVRQACGESVELPDDLCIRPTAVILLGTHESGHLSFNSEEAIALQQEDWVDSFCLDVPLGQPVRSFVNSRYRVGEAIIVGRDRADLDAKVQEFKHRLQLGAT